MFSIYRMNNYEMCAQKVSFIKPRGLLHLISPTSQAQSAILIRN